MNSSNRFPEVYHKRLVTVVPALLKPTCIRICRRRFSLVRDFWAITCNISRKYARCKSVVHGHDAHQYAIRPMPYQCRLLVRRNLLGNRGRCAVRARTRTKHYCLQNTTADLRKLRMPWTPDKSDSIWLSNSIRVARKSDVGLEKCIRSG